MNCPNCGGEIGDYEKFCGQCGAPLEAGADAAADAGASAAGAGEGEAAENAAPPTPLSIVAYVVGALFYVVGIIDFAGMFFGYDFTGVRWSPIAFGFVGGLCQTAAEKLK